MLRRLARTRTAAKRASGEAPPAGEHGEKTRSKRSRSAKHLRVVIQEQDGETTNLRVPLMLVRTGLALNTLLPDWVMRKVIVNGVDLSGLCKLKGDEFLDAVHDLEVQVEGSGESVRICCE